MQWAMMITWQPLTTLTCSHRQGSIPTGNTTSLPQISKPVLCPHCALTATLHTLPPPLQPTDTAACFLGPVTLHNPHLFILSPNTPHRAGPQPTPPAPSIPPPQRSLCPHCHSPVPPKMAMVRVRMLRSPSRVRTRRWLGQMR